MTKPRYSLHYFDVRGRAEPIRLLLAHAGVSFEDCAFQGAEWPSKKPQMPLGQVPVLVEHRETGDVKIPQSMAILRHLARVHGVDGKTEDERLAADVAAETASDLASAFSRLRFSSAWSDAQAKEKYAQETLPPHLDRLGVLLGDRSWAAGNALTYADLCAFEALETHLAHWPNCLAHHPRLTAWMDRVRAQPSLTSYLAKRRPAA